MNRVYYKEVIELFLNRSIHDLFYESDIPRLCFIFPDEAYTLFEYVKTHPYKKENCFIPDIRETDIQMLKDCVQDEEGPFAIIKNYKIFFYYLMEITNLWVKMYNFYGDNISARALCILLMDRIWLRMDPLDFQNVEQFLQLQLSFAKDHTLDFYQGQTPIDTFYEYDVFGEIRKNCTWDETNRRMNFWIKEGLKIHNLPHVNYEIATFDDEKVCYVYAVQNDCFREKIPKIEKLLRTLNSGIDQPNVYQGMVYTMMLFLNILKEQQITKIRVPVLQVLSYRHHELLSEYHKERFEVLWDVEKINDPSYIDELPIDKRREYLSRKENYLAFVDQQDAISKRKTENLVSLFMRMMYHFPDLELINDIDNHDGYLEFQMKTKKKIK